MYVNHSGWSQEYGSFNYNIFVDDKKTDYEIVYADGKTCKQASPFDYVTADWNCDNDVYTQFGAYFEGRYAGRNFWTVEELVSVCIEAVDKEHLCGSDVKEVKGIVIPSKDKRPSLDESIRQSEQRLANQEAERNRKMDMLGIRRPGEPWAR